MAARQPTSLQRSARAARDESAWPAERWIERLQKLQLTLQVPGAEPDLRGEVLGRDALPTLSPAWEDLCARSVEDNVYYAPRYANALLDSVELDTNVGFAVVWDASRLVAMLPFTRPKFAIPVLRPAGRAWQSKYTFGCTPLLDRTVKTEAADALVNVLASIGAAEWIIPGVNTDGEVSRSIIAALQRRKASWLFSNQFHRAVLEAGPTFDAHMNGHVGAKRRKDLARNRRRLEQVGKVAHESHCFGEGLERALSAFLEIEAIGWKGKRGTALACDESTRRFAKKAFTGEESQSICRADMLTLDGAPIAVSLTALAGCTGFTVKCCYDEAYRSYAPGLLLEIEVIRSFLSGNWARRLDSATSGTHVIDGLWPGRLEVGDLMFSLSPRLSQLRLSAFRISNRTRTNIRTGLKRLMRLKRA